MDKKIFTGLLVLTFSGLLHAQDMRVVTNLNDTGEGSLRAALQENGPANILFTVAGDILLSSPLEIIGDNLSVDGAKAPDGGIKLVGFGLKISGSDFRVSNLRVWVGDYHNKPNDSPNQDGILIVGKESRPVKNGAIMNCTVFAAVDEGIATYGPVENIDIGRNMILWGLSRSHHKDVVSNDDKSEKNHHSMAILLSEGAKNIRLVQNFIALNRHRNPRVMPGATVGFVNNLIYGWGSGIDDALYFAQKKGVDLPLKIAFVGNYYQGRDGSYFGKASSAEGALLRSVTGEQGNEFGSAFRVKNANNYYIWDRDNKVCTHDGDDRPFTERYGEFRTDGKKKLTKTDFEGLLPPRVLSPSDALQKVLDNSGALPKNRDSLEKMIVENFKNGKGGYIDSPSDLKIGYPTR